MRTALGLVLASALIALAPAASAQASGANQGLSAEGWFGAGTSSVVQGARNNLSLATGLDGLYHLGWFEVGGGLTHQVLSFAATAHANVVAGLVGVRLAPAPHLRFELLSEWGVDAMQIDPSLFDSGSGGSASLPYVGGRAGMTLLSRGRWRVAVGWWVIAGDALGNATVHSAFESCFIYCGPDAQTHTLGGFAWAVSGRLGIESAEW